MELRSRSRSKTPFQTESFINAESFGGSNHVSITRSTRRTTRTATSGGDYYQESAPEPVTPSKSAKSRRSLYKTSDYSSEECEGESQTHITQNERNQIIEDAKAAANGTAQVSALNLYRQAGRYWDKYPKTDYTYSRHSRDRVEIAPGVVQMPNMSRRTIHSDSSTNTESYLTLKSQHVKQRLFASPNNNYDEVDDSFKIIRSSSTHRRRTVISTITTVLTSIYTFIFWCFYKTYQSSNSVMVYVGKHLHHLASRVMLLDTWLLRKTTSRKKTKAAIALCVLPLVLFAAWFLLSSLGSAIYGSLINPSEVPVPPILPRPVATEDILVESYTRHPEISNLNTDELVDKILQNPKIYSILGDVKVEQQSDDKLLKIIDELRTEIDQMKAEIGALERTKSADLDRILSQVRGENIRNWARLTQRLNRCCGGKHKIDVEPHVTNVVADLINNPEFLSRQKGLVEWLHALFVARQDLETRLMNVTQNLSNRFDISVEDTANQVMEKVVARLATEHRDDTITDAQIKRVVQSALRIYDADRTGLVDYAMEPLGGEIVTTRCTESYSGSAVISVMGIPVWYPTVSPRVVITPGINPGECWAFQNFPGFLVVKLAGRVQVDAFSVEHVSRLLVPNGKIDSAPKEFEVFGLNEENDKDPVKIGEYIYDYDGDPIQFFAAHEIGIFTMVEMRVKSNHGNPNYTCLYRFRVHGKPNNEPT